MTIRHAAVAGQFYPGDAAALRREVEAYLEQSGVEPAPDRVVALVAPHAGYIYSGPTAGHAFARARGKKPHRVVLLGRSHRHYFDGVSVYAEGSFETPLGVMPIDEPWARRFVEDIGNQPTEPHRYEHCLEVMLPFIQVAIGETPIVPILVGGDPGPEHLRLAERLAMLMEPDDLLLASTDLSHYMSESNANRIDKTSLDLVLTRDTRRFVAGINEGTCSMCGGTAVAAAMTCANALGADDWRLLDYRTSGRVSGDYDRVVGYGAISMERSA